MILRRFGTVLDGSFVDIDFIRSSEDGVLKVGGVYADEVIFLIESLLAHDFTDNFANRDVAYGLRSHTYSGTSTLRFTDGELIGGGGIVKEIGKLPDIHCVRNLSQGCVRSFILNTENDHRIGKDLLSYSDVLSKKQWFRLASVMNALLNFKFVEFDGSSILFNKTETEEWSDKVLMAVYMLVAECFVTPVGTTRVVLLSDMSFLTESQLSRLLVTLKSIDKNEIVILKSDL